MLILSQVFCKCGIRSSCMEGSAQYVFLLPFGLLRLTRAPAVISLLAFTFICMLGGNPKNDRFGFQYWKNPGPGKAARVGVLNGTELTFDLSDNSLPQTPAKIVGTLRRLPGGSLQCSRCCRWARLPDYDSW